MTADDWIYRSISIVLFPVDTKHWYQTRMYIYSSLCRSISFFFCESFYISLSHFHSWGDEGLMPLTAFRFRKPLWQIVDQLRVVAGSLNFNNLSLSETLTVRVNHLIRSRYGRSGIINKQVVNRLLHYTPTQWASLLPLYPLATQWCLFAFVCFCGSTFAQISVCI